MEFKLFLAKYCPRAPEPWHIPDVRLSTGGKHAGCLYRGSIRNVQVWADPCCDGFKVGQDLPEGFENVEGSTLSPHRFVWKSDKLRAMVTYCEGDVIVTVDQTDEWYQARLLSSQNFYALLRPRNT